MPIEAIKRVEQLAAKEGFKQIYEPVFQKYAMLARVDAPHNKQHP